MPIRVLIVDNVPARLQQAKEALDAAGFWVLTAGNGIECLLKFSAERPDLVILDDSLPVIGAPQLLQRLRRNSGAANLPAILLVQSDESAASLDPEGNARCLRLVKPVTPAALIAAAKQQIAASELASG